MSRGAQTFRQGDLTKAVKGFERAGLKVARVEIMDGKIVVIADRTDETDVEADATEWDAV